MTNGLNILIVDDEPNIRRVLGISLESSGHRVVSVSNPADALAEAQRSSFDLAFVDLRLGTHSGLDLIPALLKASPWLKIAVITAYAAVDTAVEAIKRGASDYLAKPFTPEQVDAVIRRVAELRELQNRVEQTSGSQSDPARDTDLSTSSPAMHRAVAIARQVAASDATVLLRGESGTGKGVLARAIHSWSPRATKPFAVVSCPSLSPELLESELFGHVKGAFTSAVRDNLGRIANSEGGTLFLDEIGDLPLALQPKLLRFLQDREYERIGESTTRQADVRVIAATNVDLEEAVRVGRFREDLLYRINVIQIELPPLRQRLDDVVPLARRLLAYFTGASTAGSRVLTPEAEIALREYGWPGNIRELRNAIERAAIISTGAYVGVEQFPPKIAQRETASDAAESLMSLERLEEAHIRRVLGMTRSLDEAAHVLGIDPATLYRKRKKYRI